MNRNSLFLSGFLAIGTFSASPASISIDTVTVGPPGNADDATGYGRVDYGYDIGTYEVTNAQYAAFLNAVAAADPHALWNGNMQGGNLWEWSDTIIGNKTVIFPKKVRFLHDIGEFPR